MPPVFVIRRFTSASLLLLAIIAGCKSKDTSTGVVWPRARTVEPRLSVATEWHPCRKKDNGKRLVADAQCAEVPAPGFCDEQITGLAQAEKAIALRSACLDRAITYLQRTSRRNAAAMNDLAAAYYVRAQRDDRASDLLHALDAAEQAVAILPMPQGAAFNRALILESLGLTREAIVAWDSASRIEKGGWAREARDRHNTLSRGAALSGARQWEINQARIGGALASHRSENIVPLIARYPTPAEEYFEYELLPHASLADLHTFAEALSRVSGDRYALDCVAAIERSANRAALEEGETLLRKAQAESSRMEADGAAREYGAAARQLERGGSPLALSARLKMAGEHTRETNPKYDLTVAISRDVEKTARQHGYLRIAARAGANAANALFFEDRYIEALVDYERVLDVYQRLGDQEGVASTQARRVGILRVLGQSEEAWRDALPVVRTAGDIVSWRTRHLLLGETTYIATMFDCPRSALDYINDVIRGLEQEVVARNPDPTRIEEANQNIAIAKERRAAVELQLRRFNEARNDVGDAARLMHRDIDRSKFSALQSRLEEIEGESLLNVDPNRAAAILEHAATISGDEYASFRIALLAERAEALRGARRGKEAEATIADAIRQLHDEESRTMTQRSLGDEPAWNGYFDRFRQAYDLLIRMLIDDGHAEEAFAHNDQAHGAEPLDLIMRSGLAPAAVRDLAATPAPELLPKLQGVLPADTLVIEYRVFDDLTYAWVISRSGFRSVRLLPGRSEVERWVVALQSAAAADDRSAFANGLYELYDKLMAPLLKAVSEMSKAKDVRIVIVPDDFMHGVPFAALRNPITHRYLVEDATISIAGSGVLYAFSLLRDAAIPASPPSALLIGNPAFDPKLGRGAPPLPAAREEVDEIRPFYARAEELTDRDATPTRFLREAASYSILHFAAHAVTNGERPADSYLLLAPDKDDSGLLDAKRLRSGLHVAATRLVVLGACRSGGSITVGPQGVAPLVRPFLAAGVPGVIGTLWDINDATAKELLVSFHRHYRQGSDAAAALRAAQIELLKKTNPGLSSELTWGAYQAIGFASSPFAPAGEMKKEKPP